MIESDYHHFSQLTTQFLVTPTTCKLSALVETFSVMPLARASSRSQARMQERSALTRTTGGEPALVISRLQSHFTTAVSPAESPPKRP